MKKALSVLLCAALSCAEAPADHCPVIPVTEINPLEITVGTPSIEMSVEYCSQPVDIGGGITQVLESIEWQASTSMIDVFEGSAGVEPLSLETLVIDEHTSKQVATIATALFEEGEFWASPSPLLRLSTGEGIFITNPAQVSVAAIPEPSAALLMVLAIGLVMSLAHLSKFKRSL